MTDFEEILKERLLISFENVRKEMEFQLEDFRQLERAYMEASEFGVEEAEDHLVEVKKTIESIVSGVERVKDPKILTWFIEEGIKLITKVISYEDYEVMKKGMELSAKLEDSVQGHFETLAQYLIMPVEKDIMH